MNGFLTDEQREFLKIHVRLVGDDGGMCVSDGEAMRVAADLTDGMVNEGLIRRVEKDGQEAFEKTDYGERYFKFAGSRPDLFCTNIAAGRA